MSGVRAVVVALAAVALLVAGGCGVPEDSEARPISPDALPFRLAAPQRATEDPETSGPITAEVYFYDSRTEQLVAVTRQVPSLTVEDRLAALFGGITQEEADRGLVTFIAEGTAIVSPAQVEAGTVVLDLNAEFTEGQPTADHLVAVAQVVWTVTDVRGVRGVLFRRNGEPIAEVSGDGEAVSTPLDRGDYPDLGPANVGPTTTTTAPNAPGG